MSVPTVVADGEPLNRRIHPTFVKPDGSVSSQAYRDPEASVDRGAYRSAQESLVDHAGFGLASVLTSVPRSLQLEVISDPDLFNPAHALIRGDKSKSVSRALAKASAWIVSVGESPSIAV